METILHEQVLNSEITVAIEPHNTEILEPIEPHNAEIPETIIQRCTKLIKMIWGFVAMGFLYILLVPVIITLGTFIALRDGPVR